MKELAGRRAVVRTEAISAAMIITTSSLAVGLATIISLVDPQISLRADLLEMFDGGVAVTALANTLLVEDGDVEAGIVTIDYVSISFAEVQRRRLITYHCWG